jgi:hypothetical protein
MNRLKTYVHVSLFVYASILALPLLMSVLDLDSNEDVGEKRSLESYSNIDFSDLRSFGDQFERVYRDRFTFRSAIIRESSLFLYNVFGVIRNELVIVGKEGQLFFGDQAERRDIAGVQFEPDRLKMAQSVLNDRLAHAAELSSTYLLLIVPNKSTALADFLPPPFVLMARRRIHQLTELLEKDAFPIVYTEKMLRDSEFEPSATYFKLDTHWNQRGAYVVAKFIAAHLKVDPPEVLGIQNEQASDGDLAVAAAIVSQYREMTSVYLLEQRSVQDYELSDRLTQEYGETVWYHKSVKPNGKRVVFLCDSFCGPLRRHLLGLDIEALVVIRRFMDCKLLSKFKPDHIIQILVERRLHDPLDLDQNCMASRE